ncbi:hypothetical protein A2673_02880 [Candidatus Kaiserbacteria bacterium RIFCSPHIGHO2_01_FULL_50_13]|uniref:Uncharacterized protein n=1 Tax=Candidatus Kaiserbacteria bacterium RIFCSPLOWO2_01_FULL_50_24 TaxID=1798507 RepID=A0A1F6ERA6_9BACT|nr:MAG: hypothetical protein A2673_02880 [Candidatus Kaiserbacteria bacterium RIFCSPHIGHO2_01_FULL_50_13]OGG76168.1 MAG: hypothetical protein A3A34_01615 [Candidatus Kaiserbacteria bacterium RIFCSPLOWO2_01_FULL_50_24]OGG81155.1 MAG: hypothetical protein A3H74_01725 [Candidatus Kaiserbacteria bacterium RIFCSPLOWO2_02_FULL_51_13]
MANIYKKFRDYIHSLYTAGMYQAVFNLTDDNLSPALSQIVNPNQDLATFINNAFKIAISVGAILAVMRIAWAGYLYIASDLWPSKQKGREILQDVALGLLLLIAVYIILYQINPDILNLDAIRSLRQAQ